MAMAVIHAEYVDTNAWLYHRPNGSSSGGKRTGYCSAGAVNQVTHAVVYTDASGIIEVEFSSTTANNKAHVHVAGYYHPTGM